MCHIFIRLLWLLDHPPDSDFFHFFVSPSRASAWVPSLIARGKGDADTDHHGLVAGSASGERGGAQDKVEEEEDTSAATKTLPPRGAGGSDRGGGDQLDWVHRPGCRRLYAGDHQDFCRRFVFLVWSICALVLSCLFFKSRGELRARPDRKRKLTP